MDLHHSKDRDLCRIIINTMVKMVSKNKSRTSLKSLETQVGQLALVMQNQSKDVFPCDTKKNPKDCMAMTLRSGRGLEERRNEKKKTEEEKHTEIGEETKPYSSEITKEERTLKVQ